MIKYDSNLPFPQLQQYWSDTVQFRLQKIQNSNSTTEILNEWMSYSLPLGYKLVNLLFYYFYQFKFNIISNTHINYCHNKKLIKLILFKCIQYYF